MYHLCWRKVSSQEVSSLSTLQFKFKEKNIRKIKVQIFNFNGYLNLTVEKVYVIYRCYILRYARRLRTRNNF